ncbi:MAG: tetratricopeptide repeat protein [Gemmatimonadota bacterium]
MDRALTNCRMRLASGNAAAVSVGTGLCIAALLWRQRRRHPAGQTGAAALYWPAMLCRPLLALLAAVVATSAAHALDAASLPAVGPVELAPADPRFDGPLSRGLDLVERGRFEEAIALYDSLQRAFPRHPGPYLYTASAYQNWMLNTRLSDHEDQMALNVQRAIDAGTALMRTDPDPWLRLYVGSAYGYRALHRFRRHQWLGAWQDGRRSISSLEAALARDPRLYDCYFGLGSYNYWRTARSRFLSLLAFWMEDRRDLGLEQLLVAVRHGRYTRSEATHGLALACFDAGDYARALAFNTEAVALVDPPSNGALYMRGRLMARAGNWPEVEAACRELLGRLPPRAVGYQVECLYWIAASLEARGRREEAWSVVENALARSRQRQSDQEVESALDSFDEVHGWLEELARRLRTPAVAAVP